MTIPPRLLLGSLDADADLTPAARWARDAGAEVVLAGGAASAGHLAHAAVAEDVEAVLVAAAEEVTAVRAALDDLGATDIEVRTALPGPREAPHAPQGPKNG